jgi:hypothetical protein
MNVFRIFNTCDTHILFFLQETNDNRDGKEYDKEIRHRGVCCVGVRHQKHFNF